MLGNLKIKCDYHIEGCEAVVKIKELDKHQANECVFNKCERCGQANKIHTDKLCNQVLFDEIKMLRKRVEELQSKNEHLAKNQVKIYTDKDSFENLVKVKNMRTVPTELEDPVQHTEEVCKFELPDEDYSSDQEPPKNEPVHSPKVNRKQPPPPPTSSAYTSYVNFQTNSS